MNNKLVVNALKKIVRASEKTFADHLFGEIEDAKKEVSEIETKVRSEIKDKPEIDVLQEIAFQIMKKDNKIPNWIKTKAMEVYDKMIKNTAP
jgi:trans-aconitate methyltransferase